MKESSQCYSRQPCCRLLPRRPGAVTHSAFSAASMLTRTKGATWVSAAELHSHTASQRTNGRRVRRTIADRRVETGHDEDDGISCRRWRSRSRRRDRSGPRDRAGEPGQLHQRETREKPDAIKDEAPGRDLVHPGIGDVARHVREAAEPPVGYRRIACGRRDR